MVSQTPEREEPGISFANWVTRSLGWLEPEESCEFDFANSVIRIFEETHESGLQDCYKTTVCWEPTAASVYLREG